PLHVQPLEEPEPPATRQRNDIPAVPTGVGRRGPYPRQGGPPRHAHLGSHQGSRWRVTGEGVLERVGEGPDGEPPHLARRAPVTGRDDDVALSEVEGLHGRVDQRAVHNTIVGEARGWRQGPSAGTAPTGGTRGPGQPDGAPLWSRDGTR